MNHLYYGDKEDTLEELPLVARVLSVGSVAKRSNGPSERRVVLAVGRRIDRKKDDGHEYGVGLALVVVLRGSSQFRDSVPLAWPRGSRTP